MKIMPEESSGSRPRQKGLLSWARVCYGVDLQGDHLVVVRAERVRNEVKTSDVPPENPTFRRDLATGRPAAGCLSVRESLTRWLEAPLSSVSKARKVLPTVLDIQLPFVLEDCAYDFIHVARTSKSTVQALAVATRRADLEKKLGELSDLGVDPHVMDQEGLALWSQSIREIPPENQRQHRAVVCLGHGRWTLVLGKGETFLSCHGVRPDDASQISRLIKAELRSEGPDGETVQPKLTWVWTGPGATGREKTSDLFEILRQDWPGSAIRHENPDSFLARAVATRALLAGSYRCNLRVGPESHPALLKREQQQSMKLAFAYLAAGLILCGVNLGVQRLAVGREAVVDNVFGSLRDRLLGYHLAVQEERAFTAVSAELKKDTLRLQPFVNAFEPSLANRVAFVGKMAKQDGLKIEVLSVGRDKVTISGTAKDWNACDPLVSFLERAGYRVKLQRKTAMDDGRVPFTIKPGGGRG